MKLCQEAEGIAVEVAKGILKTKSSLVPAGSQHNAQRIFSFVKAGRHIVGLILNPEVVVVVERRQIFIPHLFAVDISLI